jgi:hypothetical protein
VAGRWTHKFRDGHAYLSQRPRQPNADPLRKVRFREAARAIVAKDRYNRKYGRAIVAGQAMERACRQGFETAQSERPIPSSKTPDAEDALDWVLIPPRPRSAFWTVCRFMLGRDDEQERDGHLVPVITGRGTPGWQLVMSDGGFEKAIGEKTIVPLVRLGLLESASDGSKQLLISNRGRATWWLFLQRRAVPGGSHAGLTGARRV